MECPKCKAHSVRLDHGALVCQIKTCTYIEFHPISYENEAVYQAGNQKMETRFNDAYSNMLTGGGIELYSDSQFDRSYKRGQKLIKNWCYLLRLNQCYTQTAIARYLSILKILNDQMQHQYIQTQISQFGQSQPNEIPSNVIHHHFKNLREITAYSIYSVCVEKTNFHDSLNIRKLLGVDYKTWKKVVKSINLKMCGKITFIPNEKPEYHITRVCQHRKIRRQEQNAMIQLSKSITKVTSGNNSLHLTAALSFWKICEYSTLYASKFVLGDFCKKYDKIQENQKYSKEDILMYFDITPKYVEQFFREIIKTHFQDEIMRFLPSWEGKRNLQVQIVSNELDHQ